MRIGKHGSQGKVSMSLQEGMTCLFVGRARIDPNDSMRVYLFAIYWCLQTLATVGFGDVHALNDSKIVLL